jgi:transposase-like protein
VPSSSFLSLAVLFRLTLAGRLTGTERAADLRSTRTTRPPIAGAGRARLAAAALIASGYESGDPAGRNGGNSRNGTRAKTVLTEVGPIQLQVPRDCDASFESRIVRKRQRRLGGVEGLVVSLVAKGLTTGGRVPQLR